MGRVPPVKPPDAVPGVVITPCKCDVMPGYARLNKHEASGEIRRTNKQKADNLRSMERKLDKQAASDQHTPGKIIPKTATGQQMGKILKGSFLRDFLIFMKCKLSESNFLQLTSSI